jgi:hypothetical protein
MLVGKQAASAALSILQVCREWGSTRFSSTYCLKCWVFTYPVEEGAGCFFLQLEGKSHPANMFHCTLTLHN